MQCEPPAGLIFDSNPRRREVVHEATADVELRRITNAVEPVVDQRAASIGRSKSILHPRVLIVERLAPAHRASPNHEGGRSGRSR